MKPVIIKMGPYAHRHSFLEIRGQPRYNVKKVEIFSLIMCPSILSDKIVYFDKNLNKKRSGSKKDRTSFTDCCVVSKLCAHNII